MYKIEGALSVTQKYSLQATLVNNDLKIVNRPLYELTVWCRFTRSSICCNCQLLYARGHRCVSGGRHCVHV